MNGEQFKELDIESKVKYINELLEQGDSVDNIRMTLGIGKNYIANTFNKYGYKLNRNINQYVNSNDVATNTTNVAIESNDKTINKPKKVINTNAKDNKYKALEEQIKALQKQIDIINSRLDTSDIATNVSIDTTSILHSSIDGYDSKDTVNRNYRIYTDIHKEFTTFCKEHRQYKVQDIVSSAIKEYLDKYNK
ncbi:hypothetical protein [Romboutsia sp.]|uniref:hypothetical protein n=1 Tax=Romboutsia sp. TaxID=1965302 RepID=UPI002CFA87C0|nr:hypothetical protein [Romboutsia sp.]HSQ89460.1 hypothetical protein [Romboutsia sp.]